jgi:PAS domain S-box-containing protein
MSDRQWLLSLMGYAFYCGTGLIIAAMGGSLRASARQAEENASRAESGRRKLQREVAERWRAEQSERAQRERLVATLAGVADGVIVTDASGLVVSLNPVAETLTGWTSAEAVGRPLKEVFRTVDRDTLRTAEMPVVAVVADAVARPIELAEFISRDGSIREVEHSTSPIKNEKGSVDGVVIVFRDVTERRAGEEALRQSEERFRQLAENVSDVFWVVEPGPTVAYASPACETIWGRTLAELKDRPQRFFDAVHPDDRARVAHSLERLLEGTSMVEEYRIIRPDGSTRWVKDRGFPIRDAAGKVVRAAGVAEDVTERIRLEDERQDHLRQMAEDDRRKNEFLATLAHELRNPLAPIRSALTLMDGPDADSEALRVIVERQVATMTRLVDDLLDVSRITRGRIELRKRVVDLAEVARGAVEACRPLLDERGHTLATDFPGQPLWVEADPTRLEQVLVNLLNNAAKYTDPGGSIALVLAARGAGASIAVADNGIGIPAELLERAFDPFVQGERRLDRAQGGLGIGLGLVRRLVEMHGWSVEAGSHGSGQGSEFVIEIPELAVTPAEPAPSAAPRSPRPSNGKPPTRRVLVVDDNQDAADTLAKLVVRLYAQDVRVAYDGTTALELARDFQPEILLLDIGLPGIDGYEVARTLRDRPESADLLLVAVTGWGQDQDRRRTAQAGFDHHLVKPVELDAIRAILDSPGRNAVSGADESSLVTTQR